jgi:hypothetical protein
MQEHSQQQRQSKGEGTTRPAHPQPQLGLPSCSAAYSCLRMVMMRSAMPFNSTCRGGDRGSRTANALGRAAGEGLLLGDIAANGTAATNELQPHPQPRRRQQPPSAPSKQRRARDRKGWW